MTASTTWNHRRDNHPNRALGDEFRKYIEQHDKSISPQQHGQTVTFSTSDGRKAGMILRVQGVFLRCQRNGRELKILIASTNDFDKGLRWLQNLPGY